MRMTITTRKPGFDKAPDFRTYVWNTVEISWFANSPANKHDDDTTDSALCTSCGPFRLQSGWSKMDRDLAIARVLREQIPAVAPFERVTFTYVAREEDANNLALTVKVLGRYRELESIQDFRTRLR